MVMNRKRRITLAVVFTIVAAFAVGTTTEVLRDALLFRWQVQEGDEFLFSVEVIGYSIAGGSIIAPPFASMNDTIIHSEIASLPNISIFMRLTDFADEIVKFAKTDSRFENGSAIPVQHYNQINNLVSRCLLPVGNWALLDAFYPDEPEPAQNTTEYETYIGTDSGAVFRIGFERFSENQASGWHGVVDKKTGVPHRLELWGWSNISPYLYAYNVTLILRGQASIT